MSQIRKELHICWRNAKYVCFTKNAKHHEDVPFQEEWKDFEIFYKDNYQRYVRALKKWQNYKRLYQPKNKSSECSEIGNKLKYRNTRFVRKVKELGFTKKNTVFSSPSDIMKYQRVTHKYMFENKLLGTRDIKNILKKRGVELSMHAIISRLNNGKSLFESNRLDKILYKGIYLSYPDIAKKENVNERLLRHRHKSYEKNISKAILYCRNFNSKTHEFEGSKMKMRDIIKILCERSDLSYNEIKRRISRIGLLDVKKLIAPKGYRGYSALCKTVYAIKNNKEQKFNSISEAAQTLNIAESGISFAISGRCVHAKGYKFRFEEGKYNVKEIITKKN